MVLPQRQRNLGARSSARPRFAFYEFYKQQKAGRSDTVNLSVGDDALQIGLSKRFAQEREASAIRWTAS
jgi:hypothetical protein